MNFNSTKHYLTVKDHSVSHETFELLIDEELQLLKTTPQPDENVLSRYYESDDYISHTDGKRSLFEKLYHAVKQKALKDKVKLLEKYASKKGNLLDVGAGTGDFLITAKNKGWKVTGIEPSDKAKKIATRKGVTFTDSPAEVANHSQDVITLWHVLEHVPDISQQIKELKRILKPDGVLIVAVPNFKSYDANYYGAFWAAYDVPRHLWHFSKIAIKKLFSNEDMQLVDVLPMKFDSFYVSLLSEKYKSGKMNFIKGFVVGMRSNLKAAASKEYSSHIYVLKNSQTQ